jgi:hypothetical protein
MNRLSALVCRVLAAGRLGMVVLASPLSGQEEARRGESTWPTDIDLEAKDGIFFVYTSGSGRHQ